MAGQEMRGFDEVALGSIDPGLLRKGTVDERRQLLKIACALQVVHLQSVRGFSVTSRSLGTQSR